jgi:hypothetical protein
MLSLHSFKIFNNKDEFEGDFIAAFAEKPKKTAFQNLFRAPF